MSFYRLIAHFLLALNNMPLSNVSQFIHSPTKGHLGHFQVWAIMSNAAM